jgi:hypothetical protein
MINVTLGYRYYEKHAPAEHYEVAIPVGPGRFSADDLRLVMEIAGNRDCEPHLIGNALLILPRPT